ncbi:hypothetical protein [Variovorax sp. PAMC 28711]|uniref:hypothetical protein n=1 Tax=Variovorax sp. PAMC 28711 TaxID=1795631 RepID=UPI00078DA9E5|nr:hypothetical protein [Variovorax sp. PAMC 28711]AMM23717.1 hypothetical protein AX767_04690 [Variovorax sp. PAMC 28711]
MPDNRRDPGKSAGPTDLIFIDPPHNTGDEGSLYSDGVNSPTMKEWLSSNPVDAEDMRAPRQMALHDVAAAGVIA